LCVRGRGKLVDGFWDDIPKDLLNVKTANHPLSVQAAKFLFAPLQPDTLLTLKVWKF
jgi:hypothetical protein